jgi:hypothetical protein
VQLLLPNHGKRKTFRKGETKETAEKLSIAD